MAIIKKQVEIGVFMPTVRRVCTLYNRFQSKQQTLRILILIRKAFSSWIRMIQRIAYTYCVYAAYALFVMLVKGLSECERLARCVSVCMCEKDVCHSTMSAISRKQTRNPIVNSWRQWKLWEKWGWRKNGVKWEQGNRQQLERHIALPRRAFCSAHVNRAKGFGSCSCSWSGSRRCEQGQLLLFGTSLQAPCRGK